MIICLVCTDSMRTNMRRHFIFLNAAVHGRKAAFDFFGGIENACKAASLPKSWRWSSPGSTPHNFGELLLGPGGRSCNINACGKPVQVLINGNVGLQHIAVGPMANHLEIVVVGLLRTRKHGVHFVSATVAHVHQAPGISRKRS